MTTGAIINFFCEYRDINHRMLFGKDKKGNVNMTRYMLWHYLHTKMGMSANALARMFNRNRPSIFRGIRVLREQMEIYKKLSDEYSILIKEMENMG